MAFLQLRSMSSAPDSPLLQDRRHHRLPELDVQRMPQLARERANLDIRVTPHSHSEHRAAQIARDCAGSERRKSAYRQLTKVNADWIKADVDVLRTRFYAVF